MNTKIIEIMESGVVVSINVKSSDLREFGEYLINTVTQEVKQRVKSGEEDILLGVVEVMNRLGIKDRTTLWHWSKKGYLIPIKVGRMLRYRQSEVDRILMARNK